MTTSKKKVGIVGAALAATAGALGLASEPVATEPAKAAPKAKAKSSVPTKAQIKKMSPEKAAYWNRRIADANMPNWWNRPSAVAMRAARVKADDPNPMTRQVRRAIARRLGKMPST